MSTGKNGGSPIISYIIYVILTGIVVLIIWRLTGYNPVSRFAINQSTASATSTPATYMLLSLAEDNILYLDQRSGQITKIGPLKDISRSVNSTRLQQIFSVTKNPQDNRMTIVASRSLNNTSLYVLTASTVPTLTQLTRDDNGFLPTFAVTPDSLLSWSPDGTQIAFTAFENDHADLFLVDVAGKEVKRLTYHQAHISSLLWLDNETISFVWDWNGQDAIYKIDIDGGNLTQIK